MNVIMEWIFALRAGQCIKGKYRVQNEKDLPRYKYKTRLFQLLEDPRNVLLWPLSPIAYKKRPETDRGIALVTVRDLETGETRMVYLDKFQTLEKISAPTYDGQSKPEQTYAVVDAEATAIIRRGLKADSVRRYDEAHRRMPEVEPVQYVPEPLNLVRDDQVLARCG